MLSRHSIGTYQGNKLTCSSSGNTWPESSRLPELLWTDPGKKKLNWCVQDDLDFKKRKKKEAQEGNQLSSLPLKSLKARKKQSTTQNCQSNRQKRLLSSTHCAVIALVFTNMKINRKKKLLPSHVSKREVLTEVLHSDC